MLEGLEFLEIHFGRKFVEPPFQQRDGVRQARTTNGQQNQLYTRAWVACMVNLHQTSREPLTEAKSWVGGVALRLMFVLKW